MRQFPLVAVVILSLFGLELLTPGQTLNAQADHDAVLVSEVLEAGFPTLVRDVLPVSDVLSGFPAPRGNPLVMRTSGDMGLEMSSSVPPVIARRYATHSLKQTRLKDALAQVLRAERITMEPALHRAFLSNRLPKNARVGDSVEVHLATSANDRPMELMALVLHLSSEPAPIYMYRFTPIDSAVPRYYDAQGYEFDVQLMESPIKYKVISSFLGDGRGHAGLDLTADLGTPVSTPYQARVVRTNWYTATQGRCIELYYVDLGVTAKFFHLSKIHPDIKPGQVLEPGTVIALSGNTGRSSGPHLHYQLEDSVKGVILDPLEVHGYGASRLAEVERFALDTSIAALNAIPTHTLDERSAGLLPVAGTTRLR